ncbi:DUF397 domain-containing protein [Longispora albida]|uniref:DUF397 domain-containing protein n=1 Tax=Longispora albida TaxID=203523 RepID=UPI0003603FA5|nr:DUF397 domain-containing protein [Longispora albida]
MSNTIVEFGDGRVWHKPRRSADNGGDCVCITRDPETGMIGMRDSKEGSAGEPKWYTPAEWSAFKLGVQDGEFDTL